jgi:hypothetical protein
MDEIVFSEPESHSVCDCCGANVTVVCRDIHRAGQLYATYFAKFSDGPNHTRIGVIAGLGDWSETEAAGRRAFAFQIWREEDRAITGLDDGEAWRSVDFLGACLTRQEALEHQWLPDLFALSDFIVDNDPAISAFLGSAQSS